MTDGTFDAIEFAEYIRNRWLAIAISCALAFTVASIVSRTLPKRYTAVASIIIQPPGGNDPRAATAVSPVYLEALKTYERFATSDTLFARALDFVHARDSHPGTPTEVLKKQILKVSKPASTSLLEISATLPDPKAAQALAQYIAEQTVALSRTLDNQTFTDLAGEFHSQVDARQLRLQTALRDRDAFAATQSIDVLQREVQESAQLKGHLERELATSRAELADLTAQSQILKDSGNAEDAGFVARRIAAESARIVATERQAADLENQLARKGRLLEATEAKSETLNADETSARTAYDAAERRLGEAMSSAQFRGERLQIIDPGIVPRQPSSPGALISALAAALMALIGSFVYLTFCFSHAHLARARTARSYSLR